MTPPAARARPSAAVYRRRRITVFGGLGLALVIAFYLPLTTLAPLRAADPVPVAAEVPVAAAADLAWPGYGAAAIGAVGYPGVLARAGSTDALPMASITKVITALVVLDEKPLGVDESGPTYVTTSADVALWSTYLAQRGKVAPVSAGMSLTQRQLLELTLIESANNYATTLARWAFGSDAAFVEAASDWLDARGLDGIRVVEPTGIDARNVGTVDALVALGALALADPVVAQIVETERSTVPGVGAIENTNELLGSLGVDGIKTGTLDSFGANLLFSAEQSVGAHTVQVVGVVLGGPDHDVLDAGISRLLGTVAEGFHEVVVADAGEPFANYRTVWEAEATAVAASTETLLVWSDSPVTMDVQLDELRDGDAGDPLGRATFSSGPATVSVDLVLDVDVDDPGPWWRLVNPAALF